MRHVRRIARAIAAVSSCRSIGRCVCSKSSFVFKERIGGWGQRMMKGRREVPE